MKKLLSVILVGGVALVGAVAGADTVNYGWEDGGTILDKYGNVDESNVGAPDPVHGGDRSLKLVDMSSSGPSSPQAYVAWITGLVDGDIVDASFWRYDTSPDASPACRIWGHYTDDLNDITSFAGSAGGNSDYGPGTGWDQTSHSWTFDAGDGTRNGLVVQVRTYTTDGDTVWVDDLSVTAPPRATIVVPEPATLVMLALGACLPLLRRKR